MELIAAGVGGVLSGAVKMIHRLGGRKNTGGKVRKKDQRVSKQTGYRRKEGETGTCLLFP